MSEKRINILMAINSNYIIQMKTLICSLGRNNSVPANVYLMYSSLTKAERDDLKEFVGKHLNGDLFLIYVDGDLLKDAEVILHFSKEMYYRIFASEYLPDDLERILWLDADIVVKGNIERFYFGDMKGKTIAACAHREENEENPLVNEKAKQRLQLDGTYFNSGVILMDLVKMRKVFDHKYAVELINSIPNRDKDHKIIYPDQDILNILYQGDVLYLNKDIYNYQVHHNWKRDNEKSFIEKKVKILHYAGPVKPWGYQTYHFAYEYYWHYFMMFGKKSVYIRNKLLVGMCKICQFLKRRILK